MVTSTPESGTPIPADGILSAVATEQRRTGLRVLALSEAEAIDVSALTEQVAERLGNGGPLTDEHRHRVRTTLQHNDLPTLESGGMIVHDTETKQVRRANGELGEELSTVVDSYEARE